MASLLRFDAVKLNTTARPDGFEAFVTNELFPAFKAAFGGALTRKTIASLNGLVLLTNRSGADTYTLVSAWEGRSEDVADRNFESATMAVHGEATAALRKRDTFGRRGDPQVSETAA